ncbi:MAG TPA: 3-phosphoshikimate 1-carboxyvinyltransferase [Hungateiclostridium thermocellum]|uniref:3-phosphoshikimate 1-carboxyvinyltransferase n=2 Tax=Acetivibrio thermocellus TaxID=1515 RepID=A3DGD9_ACET2|nr:3-phosphoshikimate 1-carboxyvinyltransferase [Acetivibrio thermocellus]CDG36319.1 3-phosphoshikimate 1-carboxyvinyltransferase [Acetivibrio thermocellus BC1]ABN53018.1 3-phosphoshikimate 1-carboxyvinyltransferase [Acetivibrio thermocellus ATCC 27405]ADU75483.1 3-phosphoshikimate 1-carboxyvinyltransferase [Acetivibrio thermocellus DSM 1313]ALX09484.1 3-phosphoshikimate 1-carboxyvinyltransferase [Acetivibrio thermocellus AD2]ANV77238.1 3-phosphoshikimate 1-carboxyvinyltransferase [Acetivibrio
MLIEQRDSLRGEINIPGDKSISHRAILFGSLAKGTTEIEGLMMGEDCLSTIDCFRKMHVSIEILPNKVKIHGNGLYGLKPPSAPLNAGRSGTALRLLLGVLSGQPFSSVLTRNEAVLRKPVGKVVAPLRQMGANITGRENGNICPLSIQPAKLTGKTHHVSILDTYIKSPLLIAGLYADGETTVIEEVKSRDHSELMLNYFGADIKVNGLEVTSRRVENLYAQHIQVPGDISIAAYFITAGLIVPNSDIVIKNVGINPTRAGILDVYKSMGAKIEILNERVVSNEKVADIRVVSSPLNGTTIERSMIPRLIDEIPIITVAASVAKGTTTITGLKGFKTKESGKLSRMIAELSKLGATLHETEDGVIIEGKEHLKGTVVEGHNDAAIAMSLCVAGLVAENETNIRKTQVLDIAYPDFITVLNKL